MSLKDPNEKNTITRAALNEIRVLTALREHSLHSGYSHVVEFFESHISETNIYCALGFCEGKTLRDMFEDGETRYLDFGTRYRLLESLHEGLVFMHVHGWIHCDVSPYNVMITNIGTVGNELSLKLIDFGSAKPIKVSDRQLTSTNTPSLKTVAALGLGTIPYYPHESANPSL